MHTASIFAPIPPLMNGDRLTRAEFERRYEADKSVKKAELIEGVVYVASPATAFHGTPLGRVIFWLHSYQMFTPGFQVVDNGTLRLDEDNEPQPDAMMYQPGGRAWIDKEGYVTGVPELIVEVAWSSSAYDLHQKKDVYRRVGVPTYIVYTVREERVRWFELEEGQYVEQEPDADGVYRSARLPGLWLAAQALVDGDSHTLFRTLSAGVDSRGR